MVLDIGENGHNFGDHYEYGTLVVRKNQTIETTAIIMMIIILYQIVKLQSTGIMC